MFELGFSVAAPAADSGVPGGTQAVARGPVLLDLTALAAGGSDTAVITELIVRATQALGVRARQASGWSVAERREVLGHLDRVAGLLVSARSAVLAADRDASPADLPGARSPELVRAGQTRAGIGAAAHELRVADTLASLPAVAAAVEDGALPVAHLDRVARVSAGASPVVAQALTSPEGQATLLALAREHDAPAFGRALERWTATLDPQAHENTHQAQRRARHLHLSETPEGTWIRGRLDRLAGHRLRLALEATGERPDTDRSPEQARADALSAIAEKILALPQTAPGAAVRPQITFLMTETTFTGLRHHYAHQARGRSDSGSGSGSGSGTFAPVELEDGTPVPLSEAARALCDAEITRIVLGADSLPLDVGRTQRLYTGHLRRAVIARDRHCAWPGCTRHARWSEIHHLDWWDRDTGTTTLDRGLLLCTFHHQEVHTHDLTIRRLPTPATTPRPGAPPGAPPPPPTYEFTYRTTGRPVALATSGVPAAS